MKINADNAKGVAIILVVVVVIGVGLYFISKTFGSLTGLFNNIASGASNVVSGANSVVQDVVGTPTSSDLSARTAGVSIYAASQLPTSPWNPNFYKNAPSGALLMTTSGADALAKQMWDAVGWIQITTPDPAPVIGAINQCRTQSQVSFLSDRFSINYGKDMFTWIYTIWNNYGAYNTDQSSVQTVIQTMDAFVQSLPPYNA